MQWFVRGDEIWGRNGAWLPASMATGWQWLTGVTSAGGDGGDLQEKAVSPEEVIDNIMWRQEGG